MKLITANRLLDGAVVYRSAEGAWVERLEEAARFAAAEEKAALASAAQDVLAVVKPYVVALEAPNRFAKREQVREAIRAAGPSVRPDLGKQAEG